MKTTSNPVSVARTNRGRGNNARCDSSDYFSTESAMKRREKSKAEGETVYGTFVHIEGVGEVELGVAIREHGYDTSRIITKTSNIRVKNYEHYNKAFKNWNSPHGRYIGSKADYEKALHEEGMVTQDDANKMGLNEGATRKDYGLTKDTQELIESVKQTADSKGRIYPGTKAIEALGEKKKAVFNYNQKLRPKDNPTEGGFTSDDK